MQWGYEKLLGHLSFGSLAQNVAVVITPIQTLGEIVFHKSPKNRYEPIFMKTQAHAKYNPRDSEQPLRYVLRYVMRLHRDHRQSRSRSAIRVRGSPGCRRSYPGFKTVQAGQP